MTPRKFAPRLIITALILFVLCSCAQADRQLPRYFKLTILHTNDIHGHLFPFDSDEWPPGSPMSNVGGAARRATLIRQMKSKADCPVLVMDGGDVFTRGPLESYRGKPDLDVMNAIKYDVMTLGNNEFKGADGAEGTRIMYDRIRQAKFPIVCANLFDKSTGKTVVPPYVIFDMNGVKIGVFGLTSINAATYPQVQGFAFHDEIATAKAMVSELRPKVDVIIALTHIGFSFDRQLAAAVPEIDVIVGGHSHDWTPQPWIVQAGQEAHPFWIGGPVIVQDGLFGKCMGRLELRFRRSDDHCFKVMSYKGELITLTSEVKDSPDIDRILSRYPAPR